MELEPAVPGIIVRGAEDGTPRRRMDDGKGRGTPEGSLALLTAGEIAPCCMRAVSGPPTHKARCPSSGCCCCGAYKDVRWLVGEPVLSMAVAALAMFPAKRWRLSRDEAADTEGGGTSSAKSKKASGGSEGVMLLLLMGSVGGCGE